MSAGNITKFKLDPNNPPAMSAAELARLDAMTETDIHAAALADPDNQPLTEMELRRMERVPHPKAIRKQLGLTQKAFVETFSTISQCDTRLGTGPLRAGPSRPDFTKKSLPTTLRSSKRRWWTGLHVPQRRPRRNPMPGSSPKFLP